MTCISVVMPAYNAERFISQAIESMLNQTYQELQLIIVDDGSTDNTSRIAYSYAERDLRVRVIRIQHSGISGALNAGIAHARGEWVAIMHADDIGLSNRLEKQLKAAQTNPRVVAWGGYAYHFSSKSKTLSVSKVGPTTEEEFYKFRKNGEIVLIIHPTAFLKKEVVIKAGGYNSAFDGSEELDLFDRMAEYGPILVLPEPLLMYRIHSSSVSMQKFFRMRIYTRFVRARQRARAAGRLLPTCKGFCEQYYRQPAIKRLRRYIDDLSQYYYRKFGVEVADENYIKSAVFLGISAMLNPKYSVPRLWNQRFSKDSQRWLKQKRSVNNMP